MRLVRRRMIARFVRHKKEHVDDDAGAEEGGAASDDDGRDPDKAPVSEDSGDDGLDDAAKRLREEAEIVRDERPTADGVEQLEPGGNDWDRATAEQRLSAAHSAPAAGDVSLGPAPGGLHADGASVNPRGYAWHLMEGHVCASADERFRQSWATWREAGAAARGDGLTREELDTWGRFAYDIVAEKARERDDWLGSEQARHRPRRRTKPLRMILTGGAGSGKSTTVRALVRARRERTAQRLTQVRDVKRKQKRLKFTCVLSAPTGTASFQMKYGATTAHRAWSVPVGFCAPLKRDGKAFERLRELLDNADLAVFDEFGMLGKAFVGKILFRVEDAQPDESEASLFGLDAILAGHLAQAAPIADDPVYKTGPYKGKGLNKPPDNYRGEPPPSLAELVERARLFLEEFEDVVQLLETHRVDEDGDKSWSEERRAQYQRDAQEFLKVTRRMADLEWTRADWRFLAKRNASALLATAEGRAVYEREFKDAPLLVDTKKATARQEDGADRYNAERLERLAREKDVPILGMRAIHKRPKGSVPERMDDDQFRGLRAELRLCVGARVLLTTNEWVDAGLVNGAAGYVRGFMFPQGFDPNAAETKLSTPLAVIVEFDEVNLDGPNGERRSFFSEPGRERWVPIYHSAPVAASSDAEITREQFPLTLAWALTHWKAQGMTLRRVRICMRSGAAGIAGIGYVAITRVKHVEHVVFEEDLPPWEAFQEAKLKPGFRQRRRMELRLLARFSRTLRKYGSCARDLWTQQERDVAEALLKVLRARGRRELEAARFERGKLQQSDDTWPWPPAGPDVVGEVAVAVDRVCEGGPDAELVRGVAERLQGELHAPAVREALRCLIPEWLDSALDDRQKKAARGDPDRVGVKLSAKGWGVDVSAESVLRAGQPMRSDVLEFFLVVLRHVCQVLGLSLYVGSHRLGERVGGPVPVERVRAAVQSWKQFGEDEQRRVQAAQEFLVPVCNDPEGSGARWDWVLARVVASEDGVALNDAAALRGFVADRFGRPGVAARVGARLCAVLPLPRYQLRCRGGGASSELAACPDCENRQDALLTTLGLLSGRVAELAGVPCMPAKGATYVHDVRLAVAEAFADLREKVDGDAGKDREVLAHLADRDACVAWLRKLVSKPELVLRHARLSAPQRVALLQEGSDVAPVDPVAVLTWNVNQKDRPTSAQAPGDERVWSAADNFEAVQAEVLRLQPDVLSLQECAGGAAAPRFAEKYDFVGARWGHSEKAGHVHLYVKKPLEATALRLTGLPGVAGAVRLRHTTVVFVALHPAAGEAMAAQREKHLRRAVQLATAESTTVVVLGDLNVRDAELAELTRLSSGGLFRTAKNLPLQEAAYNSFSWHPQVNRYSDEEGYAKRPAARFDRVLVCGDVFGCAHLAGKRKQFAAGKCFFLSDHFAVMALLDVDAEHGRPDRKESLLRQRRAALARLRDQAAVAEHQCDLEANRVGREEASLMHQRAAEDEQADVDAQRRAARQAADKRLRKARAAAFGTGSLFSERQPVAADLSGGGGSPGCAGRVGHRGLARAAERGRHERVGVHAGQVRRRRGASLGRLAERGQHLLRERLAAGAAALACRAAVAEPPRQWLRRCRELLGVRAVALPRSLRAATAGGAGARGEPRCVPGPGPLRRRAAARRGGVLRLPARRAARSRGERGTFCGVARRWPRRQQGFARRSPLRLRARAALSVRRLRRPRRGDRAEQLRPRAALACAGLERARPRVDGDGVVLRARRAVRAGGRLRQVQRAHAAPRASTLADAARRAAAAGAAVARRRREVLPPRGAAGSGADAAWPRSLRTRRCRVPPGSGREPWALLLCCSSAGRALVALRRRERARLPWGRGTLGASLRVLPRVHPASWARALRAHGLPAGGRAAECWRGAFGCCRRAFARRRACRGG